jgi:hypothetical protein
MVRSVPKGIFSLLDSGSQGQDRYKPDIARASFRQIVCVVVFVIILVREAMGCLLVEVRGKEFPIMFSAA